VIYGKGTSRTLDVVEHGFLAIAAALAAAGVCIAIIGHHDDGIAMMFLALIFGGLWLLTHLYRSRYRI
jgi:hypothetical protein